MVSVRSPDRKIKAPRHLSRCTIAPIHYIETVNCLTSQERKVLIIVVILLTVGGFVKYWRAAHSPVPAYHQTPP
jgi:hypothetical protein